MSASTTSAGKAISVTDSEPTPGTRAQSVDDRAVLSLLVAFSLFALIRNFWIADDAFMFLRTALQFADGNGLRFNMNERVQGFTSPLWMLLIATTQLFLGNSVLVVFVLSGFFSIAGLLVLYKGIPREKWRIVVPLTILFSSRAFVDYQSSGLETPLFMFVLSGFVLAAVGKSSSPVVVFWAGLVALTRFDAALFCLPLCSWMLLNDLRSERVRWRQLFMASAPLLFWLIFAGAYYGSFVPSPALAKLTHDIPRLTLIQQGLIYVVDSVTSDPITGLVVLASAVALFLVRTVAVRMILLGSVIHVLYVISIGADFMMGRFFVGELSVAVALMTLCLIPNLPVLACGALVVATVFVSRFSDCPAFSSCDITPNVTIKENGIADERRYMSAAHSTQRWFQHRPFVKAGAAAGTGALGPVVRNNTPGAAGYSASRDVVLVDGFGLTDAFLARLKPMPMIYFRAGHLMRRLPVGYMESVAAGEPRMADPDLNAFYEKYLLVVRGPLSSFERLVTAIKMSLGGYDYLLQSFESRPRVIPVDRLKGVRPGSEWASEEAVLLPPPGALVTLGNTVSPRVVKIQADNNDPLVLTFGDCGDTVTIQQEVEQVRSEGVRAAGLRWREVTRVSDKPFNCILVVNAGKDPLSSIAGLIL